MRPSRGVGSAAAMTVAVAALHAAALAVVTSAGAPAALVGLCVAAYTFGVRHAFDADHIAAIDNATRTLSAGDRRPVTVGFWFSLGHSAVVFVLVALIASGARAIAGSLADDASPLRVVGGVAGTLASGLFLVLIGALNLNALVGLVRARRAGLGAADLTAGGPLARLLLPVVQRVGRPVHLLGVGALFGLGFDTASEIGLLALAATASSAALPGYTVLALPLAFAAGMSLFDSADGLLMSRAYAWALDDPGRAYGYNVVVTAVSAGVALGVGLVELGGLVAGAGGASAWLRPLADADLGWLGVVLVGLVVVALAWVGAVRKRRGVAPDA